ncbi:hypothetical protein NUU61_009056 [Penicillium alfredii]|uniref:Uncharacterized protein n=1 Tax=Penicillium alfredii TaxID=1506179 RepID=A0A9W9EMB6_9EURO|nr:uncharacterized protein NUU61_009056 [Penicillium alfredii]KAJ5084477.1 hypothetical protein NUU61_009056 [Penicillium alfredii]
MSITFSDEIPQGFPSRGPNWFHEIPFLMHGWETTNELGAPSLKHSAMKGLLQDQSALQPGLFEHVPWYLAQYLWDALGRCKKQTLYMWKIMATMYPTQFRLLSPYYCLSTGRPIEPLKHYVDLINSPENRWRAVLTIGTQCCDATDLTALANIRNLVALEIGKNDWRHSLTNSEGVAREGASLTAGTVRGWLEMVHSAGTLQHLRVLRIYHQRSLKTAALRELRALPELQLVVAYDCPEIAAEIQQCPNKMPKNSPVHIYGWLAHRLDAVWKEHGEEEAISPLGPLLDVYNASLSAHPPLFAAHEQKPIPPKLDTNSPLLQFQLPFVDHSNIHKVAYRARYTAKSVVFFTPIPGSQRKRAAPEQASSRFKRAIMKDRGIDISSVLGEFL